MYRPLEAAHGSSATCPRNAGLYPSMKAREAIAIHGCAARATPFRGAQARRCSCSTSIGLGHAAGKKVDPYACRKEWRRPCNCSARLIHKPRLIVLDEPFSGLDALNQGRLEAMIRKQAADGATILFSTHVIAHAERLCERIAIIAGGKVRFEGAVDDRPQTGLRPVVRIYGRASQRRVLALGDSRPDSGQRAAIRLALRAARGRASNGCCKALIDGQRRALKACRSSGRACTMPSLRSRGPRPPPK